MTIPYQKKWLILLNQPKKKPPEGGCFSIAVWSGLDVGKPSALPQVIQSPCYACAWHCFEGSKCSLFLTINARHLPTPRQPLTARNSRHMQVAVADCRDCLFWFCHHWCWFWLLLMFRVCNKSVPQNIGCQAHSLPLPALVASALMASASSCASSRSPHTHHSFCANFRVGYSFPV